MAARREHAIKVFLTDDQLARLDELRRPGSSRAACIRSLLVAGHQDPEVASRAEARCWFNGYRWICNHYRAHYYGYPYRHYRPYYYGSYGPYYYRPYVCTPWPLCWG